MKKSSRRMPLLALAAFVVSLIGSCAVAEKMGLASPGYRLSIRQSVNLKDQLLALYVIVADRGLVTPSLKEEDYGAVLDEDRIEEYRSFRQYSPTADRGWRLESAGNSDTWVVYEETEESIDLLVKNDLLDRSAEKFAVVVIGQYADEFRHKMADDAMVDKREKQLLEVSRASLNIITEE